MARIIPNSIPTTFRGKLGNIVFREHQGTTVAQVQSKEEPQKATAAQAPRRQLFREAQYYAKATLGDPHQQKLYRRLAAARKLPPNSLLISNFMTPPTVDEIDLAAYHGRAGEKIKVLASDEIEVVAVNVAIRDVTDVVLEQGAAAKIHGVWVYTTTAAAPEGQRLSVEATASNRPGHAASLVQRF